MDVRKVNRCLPLHIDQLKRPLDRYEYDLHSKRQFSHQVTRVEVPSGLQVSQNEKKKKRKEEDIYMSVHVNRNNIFSY
jgi:hypothetical protein